MASQTSKPVSSFQSANPYQAVTKKLIISLFFWMLILLLLSGLVFLAIFKPSFIIINNLTIFKILTLSIFSIEIIVICLGFYISIIWFFIAHFALLLPTIRNNLDETILVKRSSYVTNSLLVLLWFFNGFLILYYLFAINQFFNQDKPPKKTEQQIPKSTKTSEQIYAEAQKTFENLKQKKLIKNFTSTNFNINGIDIRNPKTYAQKSAQNLEQDYPEIISTKDLNDAAEGITKSEQQLETFTKSTNLEPTTYSEKVKQIKILINLKREILDVSIKLRNLQQEEIKQSQQVSEDLQTSTITSPSIKSKNLQQEEIEQSQQKTMSSIPQREEIKQSQREEIKQSQQEEIKQSQQEEIKQSQQEEIKQSQQVSEDLQTSATTSPSTKTSKTPPLVNGAKPLHQSNSSQLFTSNDKQDESITPTTSENTQLDDSQEPNFNKFASNKMANTTQFTNESLTNEDASSVCFAHNYKEKYQTFKNRLKDILQETMPPIPQQQNDKLHLQSDHKTESKIIKNKQSHQEQVAFNPTLNRQTMDNVCCHCCCKNCFKLTSMHATSFETKQKSLHIELTKLNWYELTKIAHNLSIDTSFKKREIVINEIINKKLN